MVTHCVGAKWRFPSTFLGAPIIRTIVYWGLYQGTLNFGKLPNVCGNVHLAEP